MSVTATAICPHCSHEAVAPVRLSGMRAQCPSCLNYYEFNPVTPTARFSTAETINDVQRLVPRIARKRKVHIQCPNCDCELQLSHTKWRRLTRSDLARLRRRRLRALKKTKLLEESTDEIETSVAPAAETTPESAPVVDSPVVAPATAPANPFVFAAPRPAPEPRIVRSHRKRAEEEERRAFVPLEWLVPLVMLIISAAIFCTPVSAVAALVLPMAIAGFLGGVVILTAAIRRQEFVFRSIATSTYGAIVLLLVLLAPGVFGTSYRSYRQRIPSADTVQVIPKRGQSVTDIPKDTDWVDASRYALERNHVIVEIMGVTVGRTEVRDPGGRKAMSSEPYLILSLRRRRVADGEEFAAGVQGRQDVRDTELKFTLTDNQGREYARQDVDLGWNNSGLARASTVFPTSTTDDVIAFAAPPADVESLRLEISSTQLGSGPVRFTIPKSMIVRQPR